ncbi:39S ribosomal protein L21, mitochondrial [Caerostris darwini]|uniref:Large ribosomal subunit protein bL21m n=1 Tax=Caerostris darwini TaxID=1538125 RepID=A0AAV4VD40_9ARAC|nr:39S ribosomal protein L21, mitochondrial [Caerostris darwini]
MNIVRRISINYLKIYPKFAFNALLKRPQLQPAYFSKETFRKNSNFASSAAINSAEYVEDNLSEDNQISNEIISNINKQIKEKSHGRLFAVIQLCNKRFKITNEDIIALNTYFPANVGEKICLEKVLLVGSSDFTLLGRPLLHKDLLRIDATVIEKTFIVPRPLYRHGIRYRRLHWFRTPYCLIRINSIEFKNSLDELPEVDGLQDHVVY